MMGTNRFIAHNGDTFDKVFLLARCAHHGLPLIPMTVTDTLWLSRLLYLPALLAVGSVLPCCDHVIASLRVFKDPEKLSSKLQDLKNALNVEGGLAHSAEGDVLTLINVLNAMVLFLEEHEELLSNPDSPVIGQFQNLMEQALVKHQSNDFRY
jgi:DNA polymerase III alpha subunit (gram-positive type)